LFKQKKELITESNKKPKVYTIKYDLTQHHSHEKVSDVQKLIRDILIKDEG
jgi:hypothetical protein